MYNYDQNSIVFCSSADKIRPTVVFSTRGGSLLFDQVIIGERYIYFCMKYLSIVCKQEIPNRKPQIIGI